MHVWKYKQEIYANIVMHIGNILNSTRCMYTGSPQCTYCIAVWKYAQEMYACIAIHEASRIVYAYIYILKSTPHMYTRNFS